ncbi:unnamed protein product [Caenorhabditis auriculariae]|uniref:Uncharacterized protein n=1 Tax=Caenorhabditis auriculariae TaxID=2777116 RepID=A0A8S1GS30_9PELO|nr:unnamed protein product [Caenorhabditis auriculariae]
MVCPAKVGANTRFSSAKRNKIDNGGANPHFGFQTNSFASEAHPQLHQAVDGSLILDVFVRISEQNAVRARSSTTSLIDSRISGVNVGRPEVGVSLLTAFRQGGAALSSYPSRSPIRQQIIQA